MAEISACGMLFAATFEGDSNKQELCTKKGKNSYFSWVMGGETVHGHQLNYQSEKKGFLVLIQSVMFKAKNVSEVYGTDLFCPSLPPSEWLKSLSK